MDRKWIEETVRSIAGGWALFGIFGVVPALLSPTILDSPQAGHHLCTVLLFLCVASFPINCFASVLISMPLSRRMHNSAVLWVCAVPAVNILLGLLAIGYIRWFQAGQF